MIIINKDSEINKIGLTLRETQIIESDSFLIVFRNDYNNQIIVELISDLSTNKGRINVFCISGLLFEYTGFYHYTVYQPMTLNGKDVNIPIECGKLKVTENKNLPKQYNSQITETKVYNGQ